MQLFIRGQQQHVIECLEDTNLGVIKGQISQLEGIPVAEILLYANGEPLNDDSLQAAQLSTETLDLNVGLLGGKVHGSLARAGKVKGQTPKVEKQEKKKKKTGRAKRRFQYNRRFVNVVQGFGRKRGPNAAPIT